MAGDNAPRDGNFKATILGVSSVGYVETVTIAVNPSTHALLVEGSFTPPALQNVNITQVGSASFALGQQLAAASLPVVLTAAQITTLTPLTTVAVTQSGTWSVGSNSPTGGAVPANAFYQGLNDSAGNLVGHRAAVSTLNTTTGIAASGMVAVFDDTTPTSITENQFGAVRMSANRNLYNTIRDAAGNERGVNVTASNELLVNVNNTVTVGNVATIGTSITPGTAATNLGKAEDAGHTSGDVGVFSLGVRNDTLADVTNTTADYSQLSTDLKGRVMVGSAPRTLKANQVTTITTSTAETTIATQVASTFLDLYGIIVTNTSATALNVAIKDSTGGTTRFTIAVPANETRGFMLPIDAAIKQATVNNNWTATVSASVTSVIITALTVANV